MSEPLRRAVALIPGDARGNPPRLLRSELELASGATPIPAGDRQGTRRDLGDGVLRLAALRIESIPVLAPGRTAIVRLRPVDPWQGPSQGDVIALTSASPWRVWRL